MSYTYDTFLKPITTTDRNIQILDTDGNVKYTLNPFSIINVMASNNILRISIKSGRVILVGFSSSNETRLALPRIQEQIDTLTQKVPYNIDKSIENYIGGVGVIGATGATGPTGPIGPTGPSGSTSLTTIVNISSTEILSMGGTAVSLLPAPGVNMYYDIEKIIYEFSVGSTPYSYGSGTPVFLVTDGVGNRLSLGNAQIVFENFSSASIANNIKAGASGALSGLSFDFGTYLTDRPLELTIEDATSIADGDGTLRVIITYNIRTFGA